MFKTTCLLLCLFAPLIAQTSPAEMSMNDSSEHLLKMTHQYVDFINKISSGKQFSQFEEAAQLLSPYCKKIFNGYLMIENRRDFVSDLLSLYENHGGWNISPIDLFVDPIKNTAILRLIIDSKSFGINTAMVILRYDSQYRITEINEVFSPILNAHPFQTQ